MFTFGQIPPYQGDDKFEVSVSDDKRAFTLTFADFEATFAEQQGGSAPTSTRVFSLVVPLEGDDKGAEIDFTASGFILTTAGATATAVLSINGQTAVADFPAGSESSLLLNLKFVADTPADCRVSLVLLIGRDSNNPDAEAHLNVSAIDAEVLPRPT